jgi:hypothetical protein
MELKSTARRRGPPLTYPPCCDSPEPRIGNQTGRIFCASCRQYLDHKEEEPDGLDRTEQPVDDQ